MKRWLYAKGKQSKIFEGEETINEALENGWYKSPADVVEDEVEETKLETTGKTLADYSDEELLQECLSRGLLDEEESDLEDIKSAVDELESMDLEDLKTLAKEKDIAFPNNIKKETLIKKIIDLG